jgi:hypothetical protein
MELIYQPMTLEEFRKVEQDRIEFLEQIDRDHTMKKR